MQNSLHKPDDTLTFDCILYVLTAVLLSSSVHSYMHLGCVFECLCLSWPNAFWTKMNRIYKQKISGMSKEASPILEYHSFTSYIRNIQGKKLRPLVHEVSEKKKKEK